MDEWQRWFIYDFYIHLEKHFLVFRTIAFLAADYPGIPYSPIPART
jgi:hypothetical protein